MSIRIILADDHKIMRDGLRSLLAKQADLEVVAEADDGRMVLKLARELLPDVVIMDIGMPDLNGVEATQMLLAENARIKVIGLSMHQDRRYVVGLLRAGASGYLLKDCAFEELALAIRTVCTNQVYLSAKITGLIVQDYVRQPTGGEMSERSPLSPREREVLQLLAEGRTNKEAALRLSLSVKTIETHRQQLMAKLDLHTLADLTRYALREGIISLDC